MLSIFSSEIGRDCVGAIQLAPMGMYPRMRAYRGLTESMSRECCATAHAQLWANRGRRLSDLDCRRPEEDRLLWHDGAMAPFLRWLNPISSSSCPWASSGT